MVKFTSRHYIEVADILKDAYAKHEVSIATIEQFKNMFARDNGKFNRNKFDQAVFGEE